LPKITERRSFGGGEGISMFVHLLGRRFQQLASLLGDCSMHTKRHFSMSFLTLGLRRRVKLGGGGSGLLSGVLTVMARERTRVSGTRYRIKWSSAGLFARNFDWKPPGLGGLDSLVKGRGVMVGYERPWGIIASRLCIHSLMGRWKRPSLA